MTTQELECFVSVANHLSFARAARELYFSVATVSHHIQHLEDELHVTLFVRNRHGVNLTMAGRIFLLTLQQSCSRNTQHWTGCGTTVKTENYDLDVQVRLKLCCCSRLLFP